MFGMSPMTLYRAISAGKFPAVRIRGRLIVPIAALGRDGRHRDRGADRRRRCRMGHRGGGPMSSVFEHLDEVGGSARCGCATSCWPTSPRAGSRAARLAAVFESEARAWSQLYELSSACGWCGGRRWPRRRGAGERGAVGARAAAGAGRLGAGRELGCRSGGCAPAGGPHHERWVVGDAQRRCVDLVLGAGGGDLRQGAGCRAARWCSR